MSSVLKKDYFRNQAIWYVKQWIGTPYTYGGDDFRSLDCSGLIVEAFKAIGIFHENEDYSADALFRKYKQNRVQATPYAGCLIFWLDGKGKAVHVAIMIDNFFLIHAAGGGPNTKTVEDAIRDNAYVKMRSLEEVAEFRKKRYGQDYVIVDPFEEMK
jgi:cell wall-associated NlpC family hydrolase